MEDCIFCKIIKKQIPSEIILENEEVIAFKDISPAAPIHILVIPKEHIESLIDVKPEQKEIFTKIHLAVQEIAREQGLDKNGFRIIVNCGKDGCQEINHLHFHILGGKKLGEKIVG